MPTPRLSSHFSQSFQDCSNSHFLHKPCGWHTRSLNSLQDISVGERSLSSQPHSLLLLPNTPSNLPHCCLFLNLHFPLILFLFPFKTQCQGLFLGINSECVLNVLGIVLSVLHTIPHFTLTTTMGAW